MTIRELLVSYGYSLEDLASNNHLLHHIWVLHFCPETSFEEIINYSACTYFKCKAEKEMSCKNNFDDIPPHGNRVDRYLQHLFIKWRTEHSL